MPRARTQVTMRLYVWDNILQDYTYGMAFAIAPNVEDARRQLTAGHDSDWVKSELAGKPMIYPVTRRVCRLQPGGA